MTMRQPLSSYLRAVRDAWHRLSPHYRRKIARIELQRTLRHFQPGR